MKKILLFPVFIFFNLIIFAGIFLFAGIPDAYAIYDPTVPYVAPGLPAGTPCTSNCTWYIDGTNGSDSYNGFFPTFQGGNNGPWKTIGKMFDRYATRDVRGRRVLIRGGRYYGTLQLPGVSAWTFGSSESERFIIAAYDNTPVILDNSFTYTLGAWSNYSGSIWKSTRTGSWGGRTADYLVINDNFKTYRPKASLDNVTAEGNWFFNTNDSNLYVWTPSAVGDPSNDDILLGTFVDGDGSASIDIQNTAKYVTLQHLTLQGGAMGIYGSAATANDKIILRDLVVRYTTRAGISTKLKNSEIINNYIYATIMRNWPRGRWNTSNNCEYISAGGWPQALNNLSGTDNVLIAGNVFLESGGECIGMGAGATSNPSAIFDSNVMSNCWSGGIYVDGLSNSIIRNNYTQVSGVNDSDIADQCITAVGKQKVRRRMRYVGIGIGDEVPNTGPTHTEVYNNITVNNGRGITTYFESGPNGLIDTIISNNTIINRLPALEDGVDCSGIQIPNNFAGNSNTTLSGNLISFEAPSTCQLLIYLGVGQLDAGITQNNNLYYAPGNSTPLTYKGISYNFTNWKTQTGQDANSINSSPQFTMVETSTPWWKTLFGTSGDSIYKLSASSPAINAGSNMSTYYTTDYSGNSRTGTWDIGAYEYSSGGSPPPSDTNPPANPTGLQVQ